MSRQYWIDAGDEVSIVRQCELAGVSRATVYAHPRSSPEDTTDLLLHGLLDEIYTRRPSTEEALQLYGPPEDFNCDQGSQLTAESFTGVLMRAGVTISMDG